MTDPHPLTEETADDPYLWLAAVLPDYCRARVADHHAELWEWVWALQRGVRPDPIGLFLARGGGKSSTAEMATVAVGATERRRYALVVSGTQHQADDHVASIAAMLESERMSILYPEMAEKKLGKHGNSRGWRRNRLWTASGFVVDALGLDVASRGAKLEDQRPDLINLDDVDDRHDSDATVRKKVETLTEGIIPAGSPDVAVMFVQNLIHRNSVASKLADPTFTEFLRRRRIIGPVPALRDFTVNPDGTVSGVPTWEGQGLDVCQAQVDDWGLRAFRREAQHEVAEAEGALWSRAQVGAMRADPPEHTKAGAVAVDPSGGDGPDNDEVGMVVGFRGYDDHGYTTADLSGRLAPEAWGRLAVTAAVESGTFRVVAERNYGAAMVTATVQAAKEALAREGLTQASMVQVVEVHATVGKRQRAEPVASLCGEPDDEASWKRTRLHLCGDFPQLEDELTGWVPDVTRTSPNRLDAFCVAEGTSVLTNRGNVAIEDVRSGDLAWTRRGWRPVLAAALTRPHADLQAVRLSDGSLLEVTPDHLVAVEGRGWVRADALMWGDRLSGWTTPRQNSPSAELSTAETRPPRGGLTGCITPPLVGAAGASTTGTSTSRSTAPSPPAGSSTTSTATRSTTTRPTLLPCPEQTTQPPTTTPAPAPNTSSGSANWRRNGTGQMLGASGIEPMPAGCGMNGNQWRPVGTASGAATPSSPSCQARTLDGAPVPAIAQRPTQEGGTKPRPPVRGAGDPSGLASTRRRPPVAVPVHVLSSSATTRKADTYDLTVADAHEFVAGGVVVHNCWLWTHLFPDLLGQSVPRTGVRAARLRHGSLTVG